MLGTRDLREMVAMVGCAAFAFYWFSLLKLRSTSTEYDVSNVFQATKSPKCAVGE